MIRLKTKTKMLFEALFPLVAFTASVSLVGWIAYSYGYDEGRKSISSNE